MTCIPFTTSIRYDMHSIHDINKFTNQTASHHLALPEKSAVSSVFLNRTCSGRIPGSAASAQHATSSSAAAGGGGVVRGPMLPPRSSSAYQEKQVMAIVIRGVVDDDVRREIVWSDVVVMRLMPEVVEGNLLEQEAEAEARKAESKREFKRQVLCA
jgi:hypothetical protein